jgi:predicted benzoate:H+ symporter BenE
MLSSDTPPALAASSRHCAPLIILPIAILSIPLAAAQEMDLREAETSSWILAVYGLPGLLGLVLASMLQYRDN